MVCLDTNIIIDFLKQKKEIIEKIENIKKNDYEISTTTINTFELFKGISKKGDTKEIKLLKDFLSHIFVLDFDFKSSIKAAEIFENLRKKGELIDPLDMQIASIVISNNETLLTNNINHFKRIPELKIEKI